MSNKKKMIFFGIIFVLCIGLIIFTYKTKNIEKKPVYETEKWCANGVNGKRK